jgi:hypothetical protein
MFGRGCLKKQPCSILSKEMVAPVRQILTLIVGLVCV